MNRTTLNNQLIFGTGVHCTRSSSTLVSASSTRLKGNTIETEIDRAIWNRWKSSNSTWILIIDDDTLQTGLKLYGKRMSRFGSKNPQKHATVCQIISKRKLVCNEHECHNIRVPRIARIYRVRSLSLCIRLHSSKCLSVWMCLHILNKFSHISYEALARHSQLWKPRYRSQSVFQRLLCKNSFARRATGQVFFFHSCKSSSRMIMFELKFFREIQPWH